MYYKGLLDCKDGYVLKPAQTSLRGEREFKFYVQIFSSDDSNINNDEIELRKYMPTFIGSIIHENCKLFQLIPKP